MSQVLVLQYRANLQSHEFDASALTSFNFSPLSKETMIRSALRSSKTLSHLGSRQNGSIRLMSGKEIKFGVEGRAAMLKGVDTLADAVQVRE